ncbi:MAG: c-type cytochrome [Vicinamibacterales bacterium]
MDSAARISYNSAPCAISLAFSFAGSPCSPSPRAAWPSRRQTTSTRPRTSRPVRGCTSAQCALCHGQNGDGINGVDLRRGIFRRSISDDDLAKVITTGIATAGMPGFKFQPSELTAVLAFIRAGFDPTGTPVKVGNPDRGRTLFAGKGGCAACHRVNGVGPRTAPDLSDIASARMPGALQRSMLDPTSAMLPINKPVRAVTKDGRTIRGRRLNEDTYTVQLIDEKEQLISLTKADLKEFEIGRTSPMPSATRTLTADEIADVLAYLLTLKGGL